MVLQRQKKLLDRITKLLPKNEDHLNGVIVGRLDEWKDYFNTQAYMAGTASATIVTWGSAAPFSVGFGAAVAAGAGSAVIGGVYGWNTYEQIGRKNVDRFSEHERMGKEKRRHLTMQTEQIQLQIQNMICSI